jgi:hypothetical protein
MPVLFEKSGAEGEYRRFKFEIVKLAEKNALPGYTLTIEPGKNGEPLLRATRTDGKDGGSRVPSQLATATVSRGNILPAPLSPSRTPKFQRLLLRQRQIASLRPATTTTG